MSEADTAALARAVHAFGDAASLPPELARQAGGPAVVLSAVIDGEGRGLSLEEASALPRLTGAIVRTHIACMLGDTFGSTLCDCRARLERATQEIVAAGNGVIVYVRPSSADPFSCPAGREPDRTLARRVLVDAGLGADRLAA
jgi:hypothetical protein